MTRLEAAPAFEPDVVPSSQRVLKYLYFHSPIVPSHSYLKTLGTCSSSANEMEKHVDEKSEHAPMMVSADEIDTGAAVVYGEHGELDQVEGLRVR